MSKYVPLTEAQKEEIRRLTQLANRRIKATDRAYQKEGKSILPKEVVGDFQIREKWQTKSSPLSRSIKFETKEDYLRHLRMLRSFEREKIGIREYTNVQRDKTIIAIESALGEEIPDKLRKKLEKLTAPQLSDYWNMFSNKASKMGIQYASGDNMENTLSEFFNEDINTLLN